MPTNVTPEFRKAQVAFRKAREPRERLDLLHEMLRLVPKHKGTEHLQADIRSRIKDLTEELSGPKKGGVRRGPQTSFRVEGAAQIALVGAPNAGKSALHARLTGSHAESAAYPFASPWPVPGMFPHDDVAFQLIDVPSLSPIHPYAHLTNTMQTADGCLLVVDLSDPTCVEATAAAIEMLAERRIELVGVWPHGLEVGAEPDDIFAVRLPTVLVATKADLVDEPIEQAKVLEELIGISLPTLAVSAVTGSGTDDLGRWLFEHLGVVRVYTKLPGKPADSTNPFAMRRGETVDDLAIRIHKDVARDFSFARIWGSATYDGQQVGRDHRLNDGDIVEIHT